MSVDPQLMEERHFADSFAAKLDSEVQNRWFACRSAHRFMAFKDKQVVVYSLMFEQPEIKSVLTCKGLDVSLDSGLSSLWELDSGKQIWVSHTPVEIAPACFMWHVKNSGLNFVNYHGVFSMKFSLAYRTMHNPTSLKDGAVYMLEKAVFDHFQWPKS